jgi:hypothetical protein
MPHFKINLIVKKTFIIITSKSIPMKNLLENSKMQMKKGNSSYDLSEIYNNNVVLRDLLQKKFRWEVPGYLEVAVAENLSVDLCDLFAGLDMVEFHYKHYLVGISKTRHRFLHEVRILKTYKLYKDAYLETILNLVGEDLLSNELYELMPWHLKAKLKMLKIKNK